MDGISNSILGTVPVEEDGSALFTIPANTPISIQPLDKDGAAIQCDAQLADWDAGRDRLLRRLP
ncbi:MAG: hypothetical protein ACLR6J_13365 [Parabacteroides merdae]